MTASTGAPVWSCSHAVRCNHPATHSSSNTKQLEPQEMSTSHSLQESLPSHTWLLPHLSSTVNRIPDWLRVVDLCVHLDQPPLQQRHPERGAQHHVQVSCGEFLGPCASAQSTTGTMTQCIIFICMALR